MTSELPHSYWPKTMMGQTSVGPWSTWTRTGSIFLQDYACPHTARVTQAYLQQCNITMKLWSSLSHDTNPIRHFYNQMQRELNQMSCLCWATLHIFARPLSRHWDTSHSAVNCLLTPCSTCQAVVAAGGGHARPGVKKMHLSGVLWLKHRMKYCHSQILKYGEFVSSFTQ